MFKNMCLGLHVPLPGVSGHVPLPVSPLRARAVKDFGAPVQAGIPISVCLTLTSPAEFISRPNGATLALLRPRPGRERTAGSNDQGDLRLAVLVPACPKQGLAMVAGAGLENAKKKMLCIPKTKKRGGRCLKFNFKLHKGPQGNPPNPPLLLPNRPGRCQTSGRSERLPTLHPKGNGGRAR